MAFEELTEREILGLFDNEYDLSNVNLDIQQIISSYLAFDSDSATTRKLDEIPPENIYFNELTGSGAIGTAQTKEKFRNQVNLSDFDRVIFDLYNPSGGGEGFASGARFLNPTVFVNKFLVPKVEELVDFVKLEDLEKEIRNYSLIMKSEGYKFWTPYSKPSGTKFGSSVDPTFSGNSPTYKKFHASISTYGLRSGPYDVLKIRQGDSTSSSRFVERKFSSTASSFVRKVATYRRGPAEDKKDVKDYLVPTNTSDEVREAALANIFNDKRYGIVLEPLEPSDPKEGFSQNNPRDNLGVKIDLSKKYPVSKPQEGIEPFYTKSPPTVGTSGGSGAALINIQEDVEKILSAIESIERNIKVKKDSNAIASLFEDVYKPHELARIIMVRWALRILADQIRQLREQLKLGLDVDAVVASKELILDAVKRERESNPDFSAYDNSITEKLSGLISRRSEISPQCFLITNIIEAAKLNRTRLNSSIIAPPYEFVRLVSSPENTAATINKLTKKRTQKNMLGMRSDQIARLFLI